MGRKALDLTGKRYGALVVLRRAGAEATGHAQWICQCDCGALHVARGTNLTAYHVTHCKRCAKDGTDPDMIGHETVVDVWYHGAGEQGGFAVAKTDMGRVLAHTPWSDMSQRLVGDAIGHLLTRRCMNILALAGHIRPRRGNEGVRKWAQTVKVKARAHLFTPMDRMQHEWKQAQATYTDPPAA